MDVKRSIVSGSEYKGSPKGRKRENPDIPGFLEKVAKVLEVAIPKTGLRRQLTVLMRNTQGLSQLRNA